MTKYTLEQYQTVFETERSKVYPKIDSFERECGHGVGKHVLERAASVLACPVKREEPNWQHGRVIYAAGRKLLDRKGGGGIWVDIGAARGFSACMLAWTLQDAGRVGPVISIDNIDPHATQQRNTIGELDGWKTVPELATELMPQGVTVRFVHADSGDWLGNCDIERIGFAFVDGKPSYVNVSIEANEISARQRSGDMIIFNNLQVSGVARALSELRGYNIRHLWASGLHGYALATRL